MHGQCMKKPLAFDCWQSDKLTSQVDTKVPSNASLKLCSWEKHTVLLLIWDCAWPCIFGLFALMWFIAGMLELKVLAGGWGFWSGLIA